jgi:hypothetical protein
LSTKKKPSLIHLFPQKADLNQMNNIIFHGLFWYWKDVEDWILMATCVEECVPDIFQREMPDFDKIPLPEYKPFR